MKKERFVRFYKKKSDSESLLRCGVVVNLLVKVLSYFGPHLVPPVDVILLKAAVVIPKTNVEHANSAIFLQLAIKELSDLVVMLVGFVSKTKHLSGTRGKKGKKGKRKKEKKNQNHKVKKRRLRCNLEHAKKRESSREAVQCI